MEAALHLSILIEIVRGTQHYVSWNEAVFKTRQLKEYVSIEVFRFS